MEKASREYEGCTQGDFFSLGSVGSEQLIRVIRPPPVFIQELGVRRCCRGHS